MKNPFIAMGANHARQAAVRNFYLSLAADQSIPEAHREACLECADLIDAASLYAIWPAKVGILEIDVIEADCNRVELLIQERAAKGRGLEYFGATVVYRWNRDLSACEHDEREIKWHVDCSGGPLVESPCSLIGAYRDALKVADRAALDAHDLCVEEAIDDIRRNGED